MLIARANVRGSPERSCLINGWKSWLKLSV
jgi:hypothetical protein